jgi:hypothetical protein
VASKLFGIWGGSHPGGWCHIEAGVCAGTREEAEKSLAVFLREQTEYRAQHPATERPIFTYEIISFDPEREPEGSKDKPTHAQRMALECIERVGTWNVMGCPPRHVRVAVEARGWVMHRPWLKTKPIALTTSGKCALAKVRPHE